MRLIATGVVVLALLGSAVVPAVAQPKPAAKADTQVRVFEGPS